ncbi:MAG: methyl-accepting chemotaxis protein [Candidatus Aureabacteria bacterium]|nr:methyl-accepting chemotaxis protein [Candidatus Auribacterota bacterium]
MSKIKELTGHREELNASLKVLEKCLNELSNVYKENISDNKRGLLNAEQIIKETETINEAFSTIKGSFESSEESIKNVMESASLITGYSNQLQAIVMDTSSSVEEISSLITEEIHLVDSAKKYTDKAAAVADEGGNVVSKAVAGMNSIVETVRKNAVKISELGKSSDEIGEIIATIDEIADQTNLLALNAAIEAARAGEQGRGFAVVADEIRKLAERTTKATKEIADTINAMQEEIKAAVGSMEDGTIEVEKGVTLTDESGKVLSKIVESINQTREIIEKVNKTARDQELKSKAIKDSMQKMSEMSNNFTIPAAQETGGDALAEKVNTVSSWIDTADRSAKNILSSEKQLNDSLERIRISNDTVDSLESRMSEIVSHLLTGKDSFDVMLEGEKTDE